MGGERCILNPNLAAVYQIGLAAERSALILFARESRDWGKFVAVFHGFFDESGKYHQHNVVSFSGFLATYERWVKLQTKWENALRRHQLDCFHFTEHHNRPDVVRDFISILKRYGDQGISVSIDVKAFTALNENLKKALGGRNAHYLAFKFAVLYLIERTRKGDILTFTVDEDEETTKESFRWYKSLKAPDSLQGKIAKERLVSFCVADDEAFPQLQAADLLAALGRGQSEFKVTGTPCKYQEVFNYSKSRKGKPA